MNCQNIRELIDSYVDGELDLVNHLEIEKHLAACDACDAAYKNRQALSAAFDSSLNFGAPASLRKSIQKELREISSEPKPKRIWHWGWLATATAVAAVLLLTLFVFRLSPSSDDVLATEIVSNHVRSLMANHLMDVPSTDQHTVKPWFDGKLDFSPPVIDLASQGFTLIGGRLDYAGNRPVAALVYQRRQHYINLFVFPSKGGSESGEKTSVRQGYNIVQWNRGGMSFWAVSDLNATELQEFASDYQK